MDGDQVTKYEYKGEYWKVKKSGKWPEDLLDLYN